MLHFFPASLPFYAQEMVVVKSLESHITTLRPKPWRREAGTGGAALGLPPSPGDAGGTVPEPPGELGMGKPSQLPAQLSRWLSRLLCAIPRPSCVVSSVKTCLLLLNVNLLGITFRFSLASPCPSPSFGSLSCSPAALGP